jgi:hypothetical protein
MRGGMERRRPGVDRDSVFCAYISSDRLLERRDGRSHGQEIALEHVDNRLDILFIHRLAAVVQCFFTNGFSTFNGKFFHQNIL